MTIFYVKTVIKKIENIAIIACYFFVDLSISYDELNTIKIIGFDFKLNELG